MKIKYALAATLAGLFLATGAQAQPYGAMGPGMMGGGYGYGYGMGMGRGMMGSGMGINMMGAYADAYEGLDLTPAQRRQIADIEQSTAKAMWQLMGTMHDERYRMLGTIAPGKMDDAAAQKAFAAMEATHKAMFELQLHARKQVDAVLTDKQRAQLQQYWGGR